MKVPDLSAWKGVILPDSAWSPKSQEPRKVDLFWMTQERFFSKRHTNTNLFGRWPLPVRRQSPGRVASGQRFMYYPWNPRNKNSFCSVRSQGCNQKTPLPFPGENLRIQEKKGFSKSSLTHFCVVMVSPALKSHEPRTKKATSSGNRHKIWKSRVQEAIRVRKLLSSGAQKLPKHLFGCVSVQSERGGWSVTDLCWFSCQGKKTHKHKQICRIVRGLGGWQNLVYVFWGVIPYGGEEHRDKIPPKIPGQSREMLVYRYFSSVVSFAPKIRLTLALLNCFELISWV